MYTAEMQMARKQLFSNNEMLTHSAGFLAIYLAIQSICLFVCKTSRMQGNFYFTNLLEWGL